MPQRLDKHLVALGLAKTRSRAQMLIGEGAVTVNGAVTRKASHSVSEADIIQMTHNPIPWVSRAALKLVAALDAFEIDASGKTALDLGASTGGFTQVLLSRNANKVIAVDVGHDQLEDSLRTDPRVQVLERTNVRDLDQLGLQVVDLIVSDLSFISLLKALPTPLMLAAENAHLIALIKPQFEVGKAHIGKGGIVRDTQAIRCACANISTFLEQSGWDILGLIESPIKGGDGNTEYLVGSRRLT